MTEPKIFFPPATRTKCLTTAGQEVVFLGYQAGGSEAECDRGVCLCKLPDGTVKRFHLEELAIKASD